MILVSAVVRRGPEDEGKGGEGDKQGEEGGTNEELGLRWNRCDIDERLGLRFGMVLYE